MTASNNLPNPLMTAVTADLPRPDANAGQTSCGTAGNTTLPRPGGSTPNVTDAGRIKFGAGFRLSSTK